MSDQNKLILAVLASIAFFFTLESMYPRKVETPAHVAQSNVSTQTRSESGSASSTVAPSSHEEVVYGQNLPRTEALDANKRVSFSTPLMKGSIRLKGAIIDDVELLTYKEMPTNDSANVMLFSPLQAKDAYFATFTYTSAKNPKACPNDQTEWTVVSSSAELTPENPVVLKTKTEGGLEFKRTISVDDQYLFTIKDTVVNHGAEAISLQPVSTIFRVGTPMTSGFFVLHEGGVGVLGHSLSEVSYKDIEEKGTIQKASTGGWVGFTDKYWLSAIIPDQKAHVNAAYAHQTKGNVYKSYTVGDEMRIESGKMVNSTVHLYTGAKVLRTLDGYEKAHGFDRFDLAVDFGWFYFLTKPLFYVLEFLNSILGNMGFAILLLTVLFKALLFPLANKSHRSTARMKELAPKMEKLKQQYGSDKVRLNQEILALYKKESVNPMSGCLPMLIQAPIFFCLYKVFFVTIEMRHAPFIGWIHDLAAPDPTSLFTLFGLIPWTLPSFLVIGAWPILMGITMVVQQRLGPQPADPQQAKVMMIMPIMFTFMFASFPAGLVIYWAWSNILTILQQLYINSRPVRAIPFKANKGKK